MRNVDFMSNHFLPASFINIFRNKFVDNHLWKASVPERVVVWTYFLLQSLCDKKRKTSVSKVSTAEVMLYVMLYCMTKRAIHSCTGKCAEADHKNEFTLTHSEKAGLPTQTFSQQTPTNTHTTGCYTTCYHYSVLAYHYHSNHIYYTTIKLQ